MKTFRMGDRVRILTGKAAGRIAVVEVERLAGGKPNSYCVVLFDNGRPFRRWYDAEKLEIHSTEESDGN
ncbi:MAG TPA: hypothetical protein VK165_08010 [Azonexus sp.]|nr:hypothetical protein [Azonexus sp.]